MHRRNFLKSTCSVLLASIVPVDLQVKALPSNWSKVPLPSGTLSVYNVTNLNASGKGSLRDAFEDSENKGDRYIRIEVEGTVILNDRIATKR